jgi:hypothetical protein
VRVTDDSYGGGYVRALQLLVVNADVVNPDTVLTLFPQYVATFYNSHSRFPKVYAANHAIFAFANAGQRFRAYAELEGRYIIGGKFACHIGGDLG